MGRSGGKNWRRRFEEAGAVWVWMGHGRERVERESDALFGVRGSEWAGMVTPFGDAVERMSRVWARGCSRGVHWGV